MKDTRAKSSSTELKVNSAQDTKVTKNRLPSKENSAQDTNLNSNQSTTAISTTTQRKEKCMALT